MTSLNVNGKTVKVRVPPLATAFANALAQLTGKALRSLPFEMG